MQRLEMLGFVSELEKVKYSEEGLEGPLGGEKMEGLGGVEDLV